MGKGAHTCTGAPMREVHDGVRGEVSMYGGSPGSTCGELGVFYVFKVNAYAGSRACTCRLCGM